MLARVCEQCSLLLEVAKHLASWIAATRGFVSAIAFASTIALPICVHGLHHRQQSSFFASTKCDTNFDTYLSSIQLLNRIRCLIMRTDMRSWIYCTKFISAPCRVRAFEHISQRHQRSPPFTTNTATNCCSAFNKLNDCGSTVILVCLQVVNPHYFSIYIIHALITYCICM